MSGAIKQPDGCQGMTYPEDAGELASSGWGCKESFLTLILYRCKRKDLGEQRMTEGIWGLLIQQELLLGSGPLGLLLNPGRKSTGEAVFWHRLRQGESLVGFC